MGNFFKEAEELKRQQQEEKQEIKDMQSDKLEEALTNYKNKKDNSDKSNYLLEEIRRRNIESIRKSEEIRAYINKNDLKNEKEIIDILLYALSEITGDRLFYTANIKKIDNYKPKYEKTSED